MYFILWSYICDEFCMLELTLIKDSVLKVKVGFLLVFFLFFSFCLKVDSSSSDIPGFTFWPSTLKHALGMGMDIIV